MGMHSNRLIISSCFQNVHSARSASKKMNNDRREGEENLPEVIISDGWVDGDAGDRSWWCCGGGDYEA
jgi:hypothetical protein